MNAQFAGPGTKIPPNARVLIAPPRGRFLRLASWAYAAAVLSLIALIHWVGDDWWGVVILLFVPRWVFLGPVSVLALASGVKRCYWHWAVQGATALAVAGPLMNVSLPVRQLWTRAPAGERVRVVTYNLGTEPIRFGDFLRWADRTAIDIACFQEGRDDGSKRKALEAAGWHLSRNGRLACRWPVVEDLPELKPNFDDLGRWSAMLERVRVRTPRGHEILAATAHLPTPRPGFELFLERRDPSVLRLHSAWWRGELTRVLARIAEVNDVPVLIGGDFNMPADDPTMTALRSYCRFAFEEAGWGYGYTRPTRHPFVRIDHILASPEWAVTDCRVGPDFGSDHLPVWCEVVLPDPDVPAR